MAGGATTFFLHRWHGDALLWPLVGPMPLVGPAVGTAAWLTPGRWTWGGSCCAWGGARWLEP